MRGRGRGRRRERGREGVRERERERECVIYSRALDRVEVFCYGLAAIYCLLAIYH